ncbi:MAG TPA: hypothetical protein VI759_11135 [Dehalococcoidia bacterium]|nr:hypothetical protein [Dehalococcoidia bacterium]
MTVLLEEDLELFAEDGIVVPWIQLTEPEPPEVELKVGEQAYRYACSYPIKGHSAVLPGYLREQMATGKQPLLIERPDRFYVYLAE